MSGSRPRLDRPRLDRRSLLGHGPGTSALRWQGQAVGQDTQALVQQAQALWGSGVTVGQWGNCGAGYPGADAVAPGTVGQSGDCGVCLVASLRCEGLEKVCLRLRGCCPAGMLPG